MKTIREPAVAGFFYPGDPDVLCAEVDALLDDAATNVSPDPTLRALIAPHAGYRYSGPTAADAYVRIDPRRIRRVVLLGPTHRVAIQGVADPAVDLFKTPLGFVQLDPELMDRARALPEVVAAPAVHRQEHSLEVHVPFLQRLAARAETEFTLAPLAVGDVAPEQVAKLIDAVTAGLDDVLVLVSSDLSHFESYEQARRHDARTVERILALNPTLTSRDACGVRPVNGLLAYANHLQRVADGGQHPPGDTHDTADTTQRNVDRTHHTAHDTHDTAGAASPAHPHQATTRTPWTAELIATCNSGDTPAGDHDRVVGYASIAFSASEPATPTAPAP